MGQTHVKPNLLPQSANAPTEEATVKLNIDKLVRLRNSLTPAKHQGGRGKEAKEAREGAGTGYQGYRGVLGFGRKVTRVGEERKRKKREKGQDRVPGVPRVTGFRAQRHQGEEVGGGTGREGEGRV